MKLTPRQRERLAVIQAKRVVYLADQATDVRAASAFFRTYESLERLGLVERVRTDQGAEGGFRVTSKGQGTR
jgi:predicted transcriptional regulator